MTDARCTQPEILADVPTLARSLVFRLRPEADPAPVLRTLAAKLEADWGVVGVGEQIALVLHAPIAGLRTFPGLSGPAGTTPSTQGALWVRLHADDFTTLYRREGIVRALLAPAFAIEDAANTFKYDGGRDLSGFEDGTENPTGEDAIAAAIVPGAAGMAGSSFVAVQRWIHDLDRFNAFKPERAEEIIGRRLQTNEEIEDAPESAHVKRTAQESYDPTAFMFRRSMPWSDGEQHGLDFVAFVDTLDKFERMMRRMLGLDDHIDDGLFTFSRPITGGYYWCPPMRAGKLDLSALGIT